MRSQENGYSVRLTQLLVGIVEGTLGVNVLSLQARESLNAVQDRYMLTHNQVQYSAGNVNTGLNHERLVLNSESHASHMRQGQLSLYPPPSMANMFISQ